MKTGETLRIIDGKTYLCLDVGCPDFDRAKENRDRVANKEDTAFFVRMEKWLEDARGKPLPYWMPTGELPYVGKDDWRQSGRRGFKEEAVKT